MKYSKYVLSMTIAGVWMHTPEEIDWYINRMGLFFPEAEAKLLAIIPKSVKRFDRLGYLYKTITGKDHKLALKTASAQGNFEHTSCFFESPSKQAIDVPKMTRTQKIRFQKNMIALGALEIYFMKENPLPANWYKTKTAQTAFKTIKDFVLVQGRYDIVCPPTTAYDFHTAHPHTKLTMVHYGGHRGYEPQMAQALLQANTRLKR